MNHTEFAVSCERAAKRVLSAWANYVMVSENANGVFSLTARHSWGTAYCEWTHCKTRLFAELRTCGAVYIKGTVGTNYVDVQFRMRKSLEKKESN